MAAGGGAAPPGGGEEEEDDLGYRLFPDRKKKPQGFLVRSLFTFHNRCQLMLRMSLETSKGRERPQGAAGGARGGREEMVPVRGGSGHWDGLPGGRGGHRPRGCARKGRARCLGTWFSGCPGWWGGGWAVCATSRLSASKREFAHTALPSLPVSVFWL